jgi:hypothetical protein
VEFSVIDVPEVNVARGRENTGLYPVILYPNPCTDAFRVQAPHSIRKFEIFDQAGRLMLSGPGLGSPPAFRVSCLSGGMYFARLHGDHQVHLLKFIKAG